MPIDVPSPNQNIGDDVSVIQEETGIILLKYSIVGRGRYSNGQHNPQNWLGSDPRSIWPPKIALH